MPISNIKIDGLFGSTDAEIKINLEDRITIIHAKNGFGKTTIFRLIWSIFHGQDRILQTTPFKEIQIEWIDFNNERSGAELLKVKKGNAGDDRVHFSLWKSGDLVTEWQLDSLDESNDRILLLREKELLESNIYRVRGEEKRRLQEHLNEVKYKLFRLQGYSSAAKKEHSEKPGWLTPDKVKMIRAQRLLISDIDGEDDRSWQTSEPQMKIKGTEHAVDVFSKELVELIQNAKVQYSNQSQDIDKSYPHRLIEAFKNEQHISVLELNEIARDLSDRRESYARLGLIDNISAEENEFILEDKDKENEYLRTALNLFISDSLKKLSSYSALYSKLDLLLNTINDKYYNKYITIDQNKGFLATAPPRGDAPAHHFEANRLSSGEQHKLVMNYDLIFHTEKGSLVLIDEPEISQEVTWKESMVRDLQKMAELTQSYVLIATHSTVVVGDHWDYVIDFGDR
jgi:predicted ATP-binding protein involved in virulence